MTGRTPNPNLFSIAVFYQSFRSFSEKQALMVVVMMKMRALPEKCMELKQTLKALIEPNRNEKGCLGYDVFEDIENENHFCLVQRWKRRKDLEAYQQSDRFAVLMGARSLLDRAPEYMVTDMIPIDPTKKQLAR